MAPGSKDDWVWRFSWLRGSMVEVPLSGLSEWSRLNDEEFDRQFPMDERGNRTVKPEPKPKETKEPARAQSRWDDEEWEYAYGYGSYEYKPYRPFDNLDRKKWPSTFRTLLLFYYNPEWHRMTKWVSDDKIRATSEKDVAREEKKGHGNIGY